MQFNITFKTIFEYILKKVVLCIQIHFVSTEKTTRIASRVSCFFFFRKKQPIVVVRRDVCPSVEIISFRGILISNRPIDLKMSMDVRKG